MPSTTRWSSARGDESRTEGRACSRINFKAQGSCASPVPAEPSLARRPRGPRDPGCAIRSSETATWRSRRRRWRRTCLPPLSVSRSISSAHDRASRKQIGSGTPGTDQRRGASARRLNQIPKACGWRRRGRRVRTSTGNDRGDASPVSRRSGAVGFSFPPARFPASLGAKFTHEHTRRGVYPFNPFQLPEQPSKHVCFPCPDAGASARAGVGAANAPLVR